MAVVAQLVRALGCGPKGRGFETRRSPFLSLIFSIGLIGRVSQPSLEGGGAHICSWSSGGRVGVAGAPRARLGCANPFFLRAR